MRSQYDDGNTSGCRFFFGDLIDSLSFEELMRQAYILVSKTGFSYSDVKKMTSNERTAFLNMYVEEMNQMKNEASK